MKNKFYEYLFKSVDGSTLAIFRILFGLIMAYEKIYYIKIGFVSKGIKAPEVLFTYDYFGFIKPFSEGVMNFILVLLVIVSLLIAIGIFFRTATILLFLGSTYLLLLDKGLYNNHMYLFSLIALLLAFTNADKCISLKSYFLKTKTNHSVLIPKWNIEILKFQILIVYFIGGISKINYDWIVRHEPMKTALNSINFDNFISIPIFVYGGLLFDLAIGFLLFSKKWRTLALILILFFNITNSYLFDDIGVFPLLMLCSIILFYDKNELKFLRENQINKKNKNKVTPIVVNSIIKQRNIVAGIVVYFIFQLLFPFRYLLLPNQVTWSAVANSFSWRMKIQSREIKDFTFVVKDIETNAFYPVQVNAFVNPMQIKAMANDPRTILEFADFLNKKAKEKGMSRVEVHSKILVRFNSYPPSYLIDTTVNLLSLKYDPFHKMEWLNPKPH